MHDYVTKLFQHDMTSGHIEQALAAFLNEHAGNGYAFKWAMRASEGIYIVIFERVS